MPPVSEAGLWLLTALSSEWCRGLIDRWTRMDFPEWSGDYFVRVVGQPGGSRATRPGARRWRSSGLDACALLLVCVVKYYKYSVRRTGNTLSLKCRVWGSFFFAFASGVFARFRASSAASSFVGSWAVFGRFRASPVFACSCRSVKP